MKHDHRIASCPDCGKELVWGLSRWPIETAPRHPELCESRAFVFEHRAGRYRVVDVRDLPEPPDEVYPQHVCRVWAQRRAEASHDAARAARVLDRVTRQAR